MFSTSIRLSHISMSSLSVFQKILMAFLLYLHHQIRWTAMGNRPENQHQLHWLQVWKNCKFDLLVQNKSRVVLLAWNKFKVVFPVWSKSKADHLVSNSYDRRPSALHRFQFAVEHLRKAPENFPPNNSVLKKCLSCWTNSLREGLKQRK